MDRVRHYEIAEKLGRGKHGVSYLAMDTGHQRMVVLKLLDHPFTRTATWKDDFQSRLEQLDRIQSTRLTRPYSLEENSGQQYLVREYIEGRTLADYIRSDPPAPSEILDMALEVVAQLKLLYDHGLVHGNITPANVLLDSRGQVRLVDDGLGLPGDAWSGDATAASDDMIYLAPEILAGQAATANSDHYALGALLYLLWTGRPVFSADDPETLRQRIASESISFERRAAREVPGVSRLLIGKLLAKDPDERFVSTEELLFTLQGVVTLGSEPVAPAPKRRWSPSPRQYLLISILAILLVILWLVITSEGP